MHKMLPVLLAALVGLAGCSKSGADPQPMPAPYAALLTAGTWQWHAHRGVATPKAGGNPTEYETKASPGAMAVAYSADGQLRVIYSPPYPAESGTYTLSGATLTETISGRASTNTITELRANRLVYVSAGEDGNFRYVDTWTFVR